MTDSGDESAASCSSAPIAESTSVAGSRFGKTESATATRYFAIPTGSSGLIEYASQQASGRETAGRDNGAARLAYRAIPPLFHRLFHVLHAREDNGTVRGDEHVFLEPRGLLQVRMTGERLDREVH